MQILHSGQPKTMRLVLLHAYLFVECLLTCPRWHLPKGMFTPWTITVTKKSYSFKTSF